MPNPKKSQPEIDMLLKYVGGLLADKVNEVFSPDDTEPEPEPTSPVVPVSIVNRIDSAIRSHSTTTRMNTIECRCGESFNDLAYRVHLREKIIQAITTPDSAASWWKSVTDSVR